MSLHVSFDYIDGTSIVLGMYCVLKVSGHAKVTNLVSPEVRGERSNAQI